MPISLEDALSVLLEKARPRGTGRVRLEDGYRRVLAEDVAADLDFPPFERSPLDGYAVRAEDVQRASSALPVTLDQIDDVPAGSWPSRRVEAGQAVRIMTGARIPEGADAVIRLEDVNVDGTRVRVFGPTKSPNICRQGEEIRRGDVVLRRGTVLRDGALGLLAMLGRAEPLVFDRPRVALLGTGSELVGVDQPLAPGQIRNSNNYMLLAKVREAGCEPVLLGQVRDDLDPIVEALSGPTDIALYVTTGGASVGDRDLMAQVYARLGVPVSFSRLAIKPGMPVMAGWWRDAWLVALSGNPAAANVSFETLVRPVLCTIAGATTIERPKIRAKLTTAFPKPSPARRFIWAKCSFEDGGWVADPTGYQGNGMLVGMLSANALLDVPADSGALHVGAEVDARLLVE